MKINIKIKDVEITLEENSIDKDKYASIRFNSIEIINILEHMTKECIKLYSSIK